jgi:hypothetical protein
MGRPLNQFKPENQSDALNRIWKHFRSLGVPASDFGQSKESGEITIRTKIDTAYVTELVKTATYRVTLGTGKTQKEQRMLAETYEDELQAIQAVEKMLGFQEPTEKL